MFTLMLCVILACNIAGATIHKALPKSTTFLLFVVGSTLSFILLLYPMLPLFVPGR